jgi:hypothetical protein
MAPLSSHPTFDFPCRALTAPRKPARCTVQGSGFEPL